MFDIVQKAVFINQNRNGQNAQNRKKIPLMKTYTKFFYEIWKKKTNSKQTSGTDFARSIEQVKKKNKIKPELIETVDCFLDGYGGYSYR